MNPRIAEIEKLAELARKSTSPQRTYELGVAVVALNPGYLAAMAEVCESLGVAEDTRDITDATNRREHQKFGLCWRTSATEGLIDWGADNIADSPTLAALARLRALEPGGGG